jgi:hypothetical protein
MLLVVRGPVAVRVLIWREPVPMRVDVRKMAVAELPPRT